MAVVLSIDIGTSSVKGSLVSREGYDPFFAQRFYQDEQLLYQYEAFPLKLWTKTFLGVLHELLTAGREPLCAMVLSANAPSLVPLSATDEPLEPLLHHLDKSRLAAITTSSFYLPGLLSFQSQYPAVYEQAKTFLTVSEYFVFLLTGEKVAACPEPAYEPYFWGKEELLKYGLDPAKMAPFALSGTQVGETKGALGELRGVPVILGGIDYLSALLGSGATQRGVIADRAGTSEGLNLCQSVDIRLDPFYCLPQLPTGLTNVGTILNGTGLTIEHMRRVGRKVVAYSESLQQITSIGVENNLFYLSDQIPFWQYSAQSGRYVGSLRSAGSWSLARARLEAIGFSLRGILETWSEQGLFQRFAIRVTGGQSKIPLWNQLKANLTGRPLEVLKITDAELLGNAMLAFVSLGVYLDLSQAAEYMVKVVKTVEPDKRELTTFRDKYQQFKRLSSQTND